MQQEVLQFRDSKITKLTMDDQEWSTFLAKVKTSLTPEQLAKGGLAHIEQNRCIPVFSKDLLQPELGITTPAVSIVSGDIGQLYYRAWWAENGGHTVISKVIDEVFPGKTVADSAALYKSWWDQLSVGDNIVNSMAVRKGLNFDVSHVRIWVTTLVTEREMTNEQKVASPVDLYKLRLQFWVWAVELVVSWFNAKLVQQDAKGFQFIGI